MHSVMNSIAAVIDAFSVRVGHLISWLTLIMMVLTCLVVFLRYGLSINFVALQESIGYLHALVFLLGASYTLQSEGHVRVDIFYRTFKPRQKAWVDAVGAILFLLPVSLFILFSSWDYAVNAWNIKEGSPNAGGIPAIYLLKSLIPLTGILLSIQGVAQILKAVLTLQQGDK